MSLSSATTDKASVRLHNAKVPSLYDVHLTMDLDNWCFTGKQRIVLQDDAITNMNDVSQDEFTLHCGVALIPTKVSYLMATTGALVEDKGMVTISKNEKKETITFALSKMKEELGSSLVSSIQEIHIEYDNVLQSDCRGFYKCSYEEAGVKHRMAATHFEPVAARRMYICWDEPAARATFRLTVTLPEKHASYKVISNAPIKKTTKQQQQQQGDTATTITTSATTTHEFEDIDRIPPYLTALVVGELLHLSAEVNGIPIRFFTTPAKLSKAKFALQAAVFALDFFETFFQSKFPLPKLDFVALPDFPIGGMENWGCINLIETVLVDEDVSSIPSLKVASDLIFHEVSHNWFGNLVGIDWWEGLWLKEGFAQFCGIFGTGAFRPGWLTNIDTMAEINQALSIDAHEASHPVEVPIADPADITQVFDSISYSKGMSVVIMLKAYLGFDRLSKGIAHYIKQYAYKNTKTNQLWEAIEEAGG